MKKLFIFASLVALSLTACTTTPSAQSAEDQSSDEQSVATATSGDVAYVRSDMVLTGSDIFLTEGVALNAKTEKAQAAWAKAEQGFQYEATQLQEKYQKGLVTTANAQTQQAAIETRIRNYQTNVQKEAQALDEENYVFSNRAQDLFRRAVQQLNSEKQYKMIIDASLVIDADSTLDLSNQVLTIINELYAAEQKASTK
ncbi:MAG: OmpH family outer membrane protein [Rikenellaceae bacterium]